MKFPLSWLNDYVDITCSPEELAEKLTLSGTEVEEVIYIGKELSGIVTGKINTISPHPNADKLVITQISDGTTTHQIVTGATNVSEGDIVPVSLPGATLANGLKIKKSKLRDVESNGMLCSEAELGVAEDAQGIWILPPDTPLGVDFVDHAGLQDAVLDIGVLPNRGDLQSIYGLAREVSAILDTPLQPLNTELNLKKDKNPITIKVEAPELCPAYYGRYITNVTPTESPEWLKRRLLLSGYRPINLSVDITNYVLHECGQPLHAFDATTLGGNTITIRKAAKNETITTLDGNNHNLTTDTLVIADKTTPIALAGVMGGETTEIKDASQTILLESAYFDPSTIRKAETTYKLRTDSAIRFEKGVDPNQVLTSANRAAHLFQTLAGATIIESLAQSIASDHVCFQETTIPLDETKIQTLLGHSLDKSTISSRLKALGFTIKGSTITVPSWRKRDVTLIAHIAEEVARLHGYHHIPSTLPQHHIPLDTPTPIERQKETLETTLIAQGFLQTNTFTLIAKEDYTKTNTPLPNDDLTVQNPLTPEEAVLRHSLLPSLLKVASHNLNRQMSHLRLFEIGKTFHTPDNTYTEHQHCDLLLTGDYKQNAYTTQDNTGNTLTIFDLKALTTLLIQTLGIQDIQLTPSANTNYHPKKALDITIRKQHIGHIGILHPALTKNYNITQEIGHITLNLSTLSQIRTGTPSFSALPKFPWTRRDISMLIPKDLAFEKIENCIRKNKPKSIKRHFLFDIFESEKIGNDNKSIALAFIYQNPEKTLSDEEVNTAHNTFIEKLTKALPITIR